MQQPALTQAATSTRRTAGGRAASRAARCPPPSGPPAAQCTPALWCAAAAPAGANRSRRAGGGRRDARERGRSATGAGGASRRAAEASKSGRAGAVAWPCAIAHRAHGVQLARGVEQLNHAIGGERGHAARLPVVLDVPHLALRLRGSERVWEGAMVVGERTGSPTCSLARPASLGSTPCRTHPPQTCAAGRWARPAPCTAPARRPRRRGLAAPTARRSGLATR